MEQNKEHRRFLTDANYRQEVEELAKSELKSQDMWADRPYRQDCVDEAGFPWPTPYIDQADRVARAIFSDLRDRGGGIDDMIGNFDRTIQTQIQDIAAEIVRQGMAAQVYERPAIAYTPFVYHDEKWPFFDDNEIRSEGGTYTPHEVRQQLFNRMIDKAMTCGQEEGNYTPTERCMRTVHSVIGLIDGKGGNRSDGKGLPVMQLMICPSPEYSEERARKGLPLYDNSVPLDCGLPAPDHETGLTRAFEDHYTSRFETSIRARQLRAAKDLFGS